MKPIRFNELSIPAQRVLITRSMFTSQRLNLYTHNNYIIELSEGNIGTIKYGVSIFTSKGEYVLTYSKLFTHYKEAISYLDTLQELL